MSEKYLKQLHQAIVDENDTRALQIIAKENMKNYINKNIGLGTCLHLVCMKNNTVVCAALLEIGADTKARETYGCTALHVASDKGHLDCVKLLVTHGADVRSKCPPGFTAYDLARHSGHKQVMEYLRNSMGECDQNSTASAGTSCPFYHGVKRKTSQQKTDETGALPGPSNTGLGGYGMGYQLLDQRLVNMQAETNQKIDDVRGEIQEVKQCQNQLKDDMTGITERVKKLETSKTYRQQRSHCRTASRDNSTNNEGKCIIYN